MEEPYECNLLLPLMLAVVVFFFCAVAGAISWLLYRFEVIQITDKNHLLSVFRDAMLSVFGFIAFLIILGFSFLAIDALIYYLSTFAS